MGIKSQFVQWYNANSSDRTTIAVFLISIASVFVALAAIYIGHRLERVPFVGGIVSIFMVFGDGLFCLIIFIGSITAIVSLGIILYGLPYIGPAMRIIGLALLYILMAIAYVPLKILLLVDKIIPDKGGTMPQTTSSDAGLSKGRDLSDPPLCHRCLGSGKILVGSGSCPVCGGRRQYKAPDSGGGGGWMSAPCSYCGGSGKNPGTPRQCPSCNGTGHI
jgi:hypothetical protein